MCYQVFIHSLHIIIIIIIIIICSEYDMMWLIYSDFFGIFVAVSWVFYEPHNDDLSPAFVVIRNIWFYKLIITEFVLIGVVSIGIYLWMMYQVCEYDVKRQTTICAKICVFICYSLIATLVWAIGCIASSLVLEIMNWTYLAGTLWYLGNAIIFVCIEWISNQYHNTLIYIFRHEQIP